MSVPRIPVLKIGGGYLKAILPDGETVFGCGVKELIGRLKLRAAVLGVRPEHIERALAIGGRVRDGNGK